MARITGDDGELITPIDIASITCAVFDLADTTAVVAQPPVAVDGTVFSGLQTDRRWTADSIGFNFAFTVPADALTSGDTTFRVEFIIAPHSGEQLALAFDVETVELYST